MRRSRHIRGWPLKVMGVAWSARANGTWEQHLIRRYEAEGRTEVSKLTTVEVDNNGYFEVCMRCLSQKVRDDVEGGSLKKYCTECGLEFSFLKENVEEW